MKKVIFESIIKSNPVGKWYIEIRDTSEDGESQICLDIDEYAIKIEEMGAEYGGEIEVTWSQEENVTPDQVNEIRIQMKTYEINLEKEQNNSSATSNPDGSPKF